jgi:hypothetical protein
MIAFLILVALICWALKRNQRKQIRPNANGIPDRDLERLVAELRSLT